MEKGALASAAGHLLLFGSACSLYVAWRHPILEYDKAFTLNVPMMGKEDVHFKGSRSLFVSYEGAEAVLPGLWAEGSHVSALLVLAFGGVLPVLKILLTLNTSATSSKWARVLARWTLVDAFAEALCVAMLLQAGVHAELKLGFLAFVVYVLLSHGALMLLPRPDAAAAARPDLSARWMVPVLAAAFFVLFFIGIRLVAVELWLSEKAVLSQVEASVRANPAAAMLPLIGQTVEGMAKLLAPQIPVVHGEVSLFTAASWLLTSPSPCTALGSFALLTLVMVLPVVDVLLSVGVTTAAFGGAPWAERLRHHVHDLASLDVLVVGSAICCLVTRNVQQLSAAPDQGLALLGCAAFCQVVVHRVATPAMGKKEQEVV